ncbi:NlpC/P60 family protein [Plesiomonas shigelloides subsp. oncorhynchi]|nr:NlpC/P60 family protein [Plesiomonas shigelloides]
MPEFEREDNWWCTGAELYLDNMAATGFYQVPVEKAQPGDVFLIHLGSSAANHAAVYLGEQMIRITHLITLVVGTVWRILGALPS